MPSSPGTVSKILWHFTGGPIWDPIYQRQGESPKSPEEAYEAVVGIVRDKEVRLGSYRELVTAIVPEEPYYDLATNSIIIMHNTPLGIPTSRVCCLADIPIMHLDYHKNRYGRFAIGFHRESAIAHNFSPVFYQLQDSTVLRSLQEGMQHFYFATNYYEELCTKHNFNLDELPGSAEVARFVKSTRDHIDQAQAKFQSFLSFVKTFKAEEFGSIYCEREWRSTAPFKFDYSDISMIVLPHADGYYEKFVAEAPAISLPPTVSIVAWDDLVEH